MSGAWRSSETLVRFGKSSVRQRRAACERFNFEKKLFCSECATVAGQVKSPTEIAVPCHPGEFYCCARRDESRDFWQGSPQSPAHVQVKAAGGVRDYAGILAVREIGVSRVGASRTKDMLDECRRQLGLEPINVSATGGAGY